jgi:hypothetical protein
MTNLWSAHYFRGSMFEWEVHLFAIPPVVYFVGNCFSFNVCYDQLQKKMACNFIHFQGDFPTFLAPHWDGARIMWAGQSTCRLLVGTQLNIIIQDVVYNILVIPRDDTTLIRVYTDLLFLVCFSGGRQVGIHDNVPILDIIYYFNTISVDVINVISSQYFQLTDYPKWCVLLFRVTQCNYILLKSSFLTNARSIGCSNI